MYSVSYFYLFIFLQYTLILSINNTPSSPCVYSQSYWSNLTSKWPDITILALPYYNSNNTIPPTMCGVNWRDLLSINTIKMAIPSNMYWLMTFQQLSTCILNLAYIKQTNISQSSSFNIDINITNTIMFLCDSLSRTCNNISNWPNDNDQNTIIKIYDSIKLLHYFNMGIIGPGQCINEFSLYNISSSFYFFNTPDLIIIPPPPYDSNYSTTLDNNTRIYSLLTDDYKFKQFLLVLTIIGWLVVIPFLFVTLIIIANRRRAYFKKQDDLQEISTTTSTSTSTSTSTKDGKKKKKKNQIEIVT